MPTTGLKNFDYLKDSYGPKNVPIDFLLTLKTSYNIPLLEVSAQRNNFFLSWRVKCTKLWLEQELFDAPFINFYHILILKMHRRHLEPKQMDQISKSPK